MATVDGKLDNGLDGAAATIREVAAGLGYAVDEGASRPPATLVLKKGVSAFSWGSQLTVALAPAGPGATDVTVTTKETFALFDWGRGKRAAGRLLDALGAHRPE